MTYTVIKRLETRGVLKNENAVVTSLVSRKEIQAAEVTEFIENGSGGLPAFIAAYTKQQRLIAQQIQDIQKFIDAFQTSEKA